VKISRCGALQRYRVRISAILGVVTIDNPGFSLRWLGRSQAQKEEHR
jgi:hypothetical protein